MDSSGRTCDEGDARATGSDADGDPCPTGPRRGLSVGPRRAVPVQGLRASEGDVVVVTVSGTIDIFTARRVRDVLIEQVIMGRLHLVVDVGTATFADPTAVSVLIGVPWWRMHACGGCLALAGASGPIQKILHRSRGFSVYDTADDAVRACRDGRIGPSAISAVDRRSS